MVTGVTITHVQGSDMSYPVTVETPPLTACVDITGWAISFMVKRAKSDTDLQARITKTTAGGTLSISGTFHADPATNTQVVNIPVLRADTTALSPGLNVWELRRVDSGLNTPLITGIFEIVRGVHQ